MHGFHRFTLRNGAVVWLLSMALLPAAVAQVSVKASLSRPSVELGESVQLQIEITGHQRDVPAPAIRIGEMDVVHVGQRVGSTTNFDGARLQTSAHTLHSYQLTPRKAGDLQIPGIAVEVDGRTYKTPPMALKVENAAGGKSNRASSDSAEGNLAFAELIVPRRSAFVGEVLNVALNFHLDPNVPAELEQMPEIRGSGFTAQKMPEPLQQRSRKHGREWKTVTFRTAISPGKAGKIALGPVEIAFIAQLPAQRRRAAPRDLFDSFFDDPFFDRMRSERRRYRVEAPAVEIDVKPLPAQGRPREFSGAIGQFKMSVEATPNRVKIGDPITMRSTITGTGNFDRMQAPILVEPAGWHAYPVSENFEPGDDLKTTGTKTFEMPVVPERVHQQMPRLAFAFFDPEKAEYVTLTSAPAALTIEAAPGPPRAAPEPPPAPRPAAAPMPKTEPAAPAPTDILGLRYDAGKRQATFAPLFARRGFWLAQLLPLAVLAALIGARFWQRDARASRIGALQRERDRLWHRIRQENGGPEFYEMAARLVQVDTALRTGGEPASVDAISAQRARALDEETATQIEEIFNARAELLYAGGGAQSTTVSPADRSKLLGALDRMMKQ